MNSEPPPRMLQSLTRVPRLLLAVAGCGLGLSATAKMEEWKDSQGTSFRAEPAGSLGPFALFRSSPTTGRRLAWRFLSPADCVRFYELTKTKPGRADDWAKASGLVTREMIGNVRRVEGEKLVAADLTGRPEPEVIIVFFVSNSVSASWGMLGHSGPAIEKLKQSFPGQLEGLFFGLRHSVIEHAGMAAQMKVTWLVTDLREQRRLETLARFAPPEGEFSLVALNRDGVLLFVASSPTEPQMDKFFGDVTALLELAQPGNPHSWPDRAAYLRAVQPVIYAHGRSEPVLMGNPFVAEGLKQRKIRRIDARIEVAADGEVKTVTIGEDGGVPANLMAPLSDALKKACLFVPAVENGSFVDATFAYHMEIP